MSKNPTLPIKSSLPEKSFSNLTLTEKNPLRIAVLGDLHWEEEERAVFEKAREQILKQNPHMLVSLGDVGGYSHPGSQQSFDEAKEYFNSFGIPYYTLLGNHDLEGKEFSTDRENQLAWQNTFGYSKPYYAIENQSFKALLLSTTRFRENLHSCHEVYIDPKQREWFKQEIETVAQNKKPLLVFSHAPILGSGIKVIENIHLKVPNAYLNHTFEPDFFYKCIEKLSQPVIWFSAHNHLGQHYSNSLTTQNNLLFCHTGVIGGISRDGSRFSRLLEVSRGKNASPQSDSQTDKPSQHSSQANVPSGQSPFKLYSFDHQEGTFKANPLPHPLDPVGKLEPVQLNPSGKVKPAILKQPSKTQLKNKTSPLKEVSASSIEKPYTLGNSFFYLKGSMLIEMNRELNSPLGVVSENCEDFAIENEKLYIWRKGKKQHIPFHHDRGGYFKVAFPNHR